MNYNFLEKDSVVVMNVVMNNLENYLPNDMVNEDEEL